MELNTFDHEGVRSFGNIIYSCLIPNDTQWEHRMPTHSLIFVRQGKLVVEERDKSTEILAGEYVFIRRDCTVKVKKVSLEGEPYRGINISLSRNAVKEYYSSQLNTEKLPRNVRSFPESVVKLPKRVELVGLFASILPYVDSDECPADEILQMKVREAIVCLTSINEQFYPILFDFNELWKIDILDFMEKNYTEDLTIEEFASYTGRSLATFKRDFAQVSNVPPQKWIIAHRLELAKQLLQQGSKKAIDVCYQVGFKNRSHFFTAFKRYYGYAPNQIGIAITP